MKRFEFADIYLIKALIYGVFAIYTDTHVLEKGLFFLSGLMFVFYLKLSLKNEKNI